MDPYNDMTLAARRARESRWNAKTCARVVHPRFGEVIVPHTSNYAAIRDGALWAAENNNAALPETDLTECGDGWKPITDVEGRPLYVSVHRGKITFTTNPNIHHDYDGSEWADVRMDCDSEQLRALALFAGEEKAGCYVDSTEGEYILFRGGYWGNGGGAGVFSSNLSNPRSNADGGFGGRSAYFKKH